MKKSRHDTSENRNTRGQYNARNEAVVKCAQRLNRFRVALGLSVKDFADAVGVSVPSLRYFLGNASAHYSARRHKRGPYARTLTPILGFRLPRDLRRLLLDVIKFNKRVVTPLLRK
jgi:transcriptional regulator with XRE-family HTH domain